LIEPSVSGVEDGDSHQKCLLYFSANAGARLWFDLPICWKCVQEVQRVAEGIVASLLLGAGSMEWRWRGVGSMT
jgi:hypothetical protein